MQNWMAGFIIAACLFYGFLLVSRNEQQAAANSSAQAALAPAPTPVSPRSLVADNETATANETSGPTAAGTALLSFGGYPCGADCSIQQAGYQWAERNNISDPDSCTGTSAEFIEGCRVYALKRSPIGNG